MSANSAAAAAEALAAAVQADGGGAGGGTAGPGAAAAVEPVAVNPPEPAAPQVDAGTTEDESTDSLLRSADIDLSGLTPDQKAWLDAREREMQAVMTKRTQEAAEIKQMYEDLDPTAAREALAFYEGVRTDPNYAAEVYDFLTTNLMAAGYSPAQAAAAAMGAVKEEPAETLAPAFEDDPDEAVKYRLEQLDKRQQEIDQRFDALAAREREQVLVNEILKQDNAIRDAKGYDDETMDYIYMLAESTQGDLFKAEEVYSGLQERAVQSYIAKKESADDPAPVAAAPAVVPTSFPSLDAAHNAALERLRTELAQGG